MLFRSGNSMEFYDLILPGDPSQVTMNGKSYNWQTWGEILRPEAGTEVWARYAGEFYGAKPAVTFRRLGKGTVTHVGVDTMSGELEAEVMKKLYATLGVEVMDLPDGVTLEYRNGFCVVLNYSDKPYTHSMPKGAKVLVGEQTIPTAGVLVFEAK